MLSQKIIKKHRKKRKKKESEREKKERGKEEGWESCVRIVSTNHIQSVKKQLK